MLCRPALTIAVIKLIRSYTDDQGYSEEAFDGTCVIIEEVLGKKALETFLSHIGSTEGRFYLKEVILDELIKGMLDQTQPLIIG